MKKWYKENEQRFISNTSSEFDTVPQIQFGHYFITRTAVITSISMLIGLFGLSTLVGCTQSDHENNQQSNTQTHQQAQNQSQEPLNTDSSIAQNHTNKNLADAGHDVSIDPNIHANSHSSSNATKNSAQNDGQTASTQHISKNKSAINHTIHPASFDTNNIYTYQGKLGKNTDIRLSLRASSSRPHIPSDDKSHTSNHKTYLRGYLNYLPRTGNTIAVFGQIHTKQHRQQIFIDEFLVDEEEVLEATVSENVLDAVQISGVIQAELSDDLQQLTGTWSSPDGKKSYDISLKQTKVQAYTQNNDEDADIASGYYQWQTATEDIFGAYGYQHPNQLSRILKVKPVDEQSMSVLILSGKTEEQLETVFSAVMPIASQFNYVVADRNNCQLDFDFHPDVVFVSQDAASCGKADLQVSGTYRMYAGIFPPLYDVKSFFSILSTEAFEYTADGIDYDEMQQLMETGTSTNWKIASQDQHSMTITNLHNGDNRLNVWLLKAQPDDFSQPPKLAIYTVNGQSTHFEFIHPGAQDIESIDLLPKISARDFYRPDRQLNELPFDSTEDSNTNNDNQTANNSEIKNIGDIDNTDNNDDADNINDINNINNVENLDDYDSHVQYILSDASNKTITAELNTWNDPAFAKIPPDFAIKINWNGVEFVVDKQPK